MKELIVWIEVPQEEALKRIQDGETGFTPATLNYYDPQNIWLKRVVIPIYTDQEIKDKAKETLISGTFQFDGYVLGYKACIDSLNKRK